MYSQVVGSMYSLQMNEESRSWGQCIRVVNQHGRGAKIGNHVIRDAEGRGAKALELLSLYYDIQGPRTKILA